MKQHSPPEMLEKSKWDTNGRKILMEIILQTAKLEICHKFYGTVVTERPH